MNQSPRQHSFSRTSIRLSLQGNAAASPTRAECLIADQIRELLEAACAARLGAAQMNLGDWRDVEQELKQKLENQSRKTKR
jgi:hypothetical protein